MDGDLEIMVSVCAKKSLNHEQQRRIELKCIELEAMLEEQGLTQAEVNDKVHQLRTILTEGEIARQMNQIDDKKPSFLSDPCIEAQKCTETHKETVSIASETIGSSNSSGKTSPIDLPGKATSPERETPTKSKKRKRKSRDSSLSSERKKKYSKKSKRKSLNDAREKSHKKAKKDKEKYLVKKSSYRKDVKQKKGSDSDCRKKKSKKRSSRKHRISSARTDGKGNDDDRSPSSQRIEEKSNGDGKKKKRSRSKDRRRESRKRKRERNRSKDKSHHKRSSRKRSSSSSSESDHKEIDARPKSADLKIISKPNTPLPEFVASSNDFVEKNDCNPLDNNFNKDKEENLGKEIVVCEPIEELTVDLTEPLKEDVTPEKYKAPKLEVGRRERVPEIAPFRIEPRNNLLLREKMARTFSSPFKRAEENAKPAALVPKINEVGTLVEDPLEKVEIAEEISAPDPQPEKETIQKDWNTVSTQQYEPTAVDEVKTLDSKRCWSSSASSSSRSSRGGSVCSTCSSDGSGKYDPGRDRKRRYHSGSPSSRSSSSTHHSRSRSPSIPRRRGSPSFLDRRRITSARKRPIPYHRSSPMSSSSESRRYSNNGYSSSDNDDSSVSSYSGRSWSRSRSRSDSREYSC